jgi:penicillin amidase
MADDADFFIEQEHPTDSTRYLANVTDAESTWASYAYSVHYIAVKGAEPVQHLVKKTQNGPVVNSLISNVRIAKKPPISYSWTGFIPSREFSAIAGSNRARTREAFYEAIQHFKVPSQNVIFADTSGFIARWTMGRIPKSSPELPLFRQGSNAAHRWSGFYEMDALPHDVNPPSGFIASANNSISRDGVYLSRYWEPPSRYQRINEVLEAAELATPEHFRALAADIRSPHAAFVMTQVLPVFKRFPQRESVQKTVSYLSNWNLEYDPTSTAAGIFDAFFVELTRLVLEDEIGPELFSAFTQLENVPVRAMHEVLRQDSLFFDNLRTPDVETRDTMIVRALDTALERLVARYGDQPHQWRWGNVHTVTLSPILFGEAAKSEGAPAALKLIVRAFLQIGPNPSPGNGMTVNNGQYSWNAPFEQVLGPSVRRIVDLSNPDISYSILPAGQSGNPFSLHYQDQHQLWLQGKNRPFHHAIPKSEIKHTLRLEPLQ